MKIMSVLPFSVANWKLIDDISSEKVRVEDVNIHQLAVACFSLLPHVVLDRLRRAYKQNKSLKEIKAKIKDIYNNNFHHSTLLHKLIDRNPEAVKSVITIMKKFWPKLWIPHVANNKGITPLK
jgi:hypothetical protein